MQNDYAKIIQERANHVFDVMAKRVSPEDMERIHAAFELAREASCASEAQDRRTVYPSSYSGGKYCSGRTDARC